MSASTLLYLCAMAAVFAGEQIVGETTALRWALDGVGAVGLAGAALWRASKARGSDDEGLEEGHRTALALILVGAGSLLLYILSLEATAETIGLSREGATRWSGSWGAIWPIIWLCGTLPLLAVDRAIRRSPVVTPTRQVRRSVQHGLSAALAISLMFPVNYLASRHGTQWNLAYFETAEAGESTRALVESLETPVHVYAFFPPASRVSEEIETYFQPLEGSNLTFRLLDQTAHPRLSRALEVRQNGRIAFSDRRVAPGSPADDSESGGEANEDRVVESLEVATDFDRAESDLKRLDRRVREKLSTVARGKRVAYLTSGHGEFSTERSAPRERRIAGFEKILEATGFRIETTGLGEGLADGVPDDADLVAVLGPTDPFLDAEIDSLRAYLDRGGSLLAALEPRYSRGDREVPDREEEPLGGLLDRFGLRLGEGVLAADRSIVPIANNRTDRLNLVTDRFSSHPSTATLSEAGLPLFAPTAAPLVTSKVSEVDRTVTVRSPSHTWVDRNGNLGFDGDAGEERSSHPLVAALEPNTDANWRAVVASDATLFADMALGNRGNQQFAHDVTQWLVGRSELTGRVSDETDVRIRHTKQGEAIWFYGTVLGVPVLLFAAGAFRIWRRRRGGEE